MMGVNEVIQSDPEPSNKERAILAAAKSGIDLSLPLEDQPNRREIIEILNNEDNKILDQFINDEGIHYPMTVQR
jgi:hypothetical protein